ncbi:hypothetical protein KOI35_20945 [Actinoplanes bogorensis]|uniref:Preprotein translocase subunit SecD n=1 Tax=Paractinoplanes bogorensis TaxID=1610840 RepID=A0ABS5YR96_9ACTN|nr:hypothetical protein [Actinoplanes bogorensis]MBU2665983.1 hypothetical protein [Actinoplanes bogorensis]
MRFLAAVLGVVLVSGCAVNKGTALASDFDDDWRGTPDVAEVLSSGDNALPFAGTATGELVVADGTGAGRVTQLVGELQKYVTRNKHVTGRLTADRITFTVVPTATLNTEALALWQSLAADDRVLEADLDQSDAGDLVRRRFTVTAGDPDTVMDVFHDMVADGGRHEPLREVQSLTVMTGPRVRPYLYVQTDQKGNVPEPQILAYEAVRSEFEVPHASVRADVQAGSIVRIMVAPGDVAAATEVARRAAPGLGTSLRVSDHP